MTHEPAQVDTSLAAQAFNELRGEVSLLRRGVERLTDERSSSPDYGPSLEALSRRLEDICKWAQRVSEKPALQLTPVKLAAEIAEAAANSRRHDEQTLGRATDNMMRAIDRIDLASRRLRTASDQERELLRNRIAFAVAGMVTFAILPGAVARSLPPRWGVPERMAARLLGSEMWDAGQQMMRRADPERWAELVAHVRQAEPAQSGGKTTGTKNKDAAAPKDS